MSSKLEPAIWSRDTGQWIPCFDRCQLTITWMSNSAKDAITQAGVHGRHHARLHHAYEPTGHDHQEKINL